MSAVATRPPRPPAQPPKPPAEMPPEPPRGGTIKRMLLGIAVIVVGSAAVSGVYIGTEVGKLKKALTANPSLKVAPGQLASAGSGAPQTLLLVGDDQRALTRFYHHAVLPHSNEMLLVRFDPSKPYISMLSIPRDLQVPIIQPNGLTVTTRFNYAYTAGGIPTLLSTIKRILGLSVNHVVVITFARFKRAVDEMGCVYSTIDHRYFHSNVGSFEQYQEINLQPGYQRLCGPQALQYVSYRHGDTALIRDARNQSFLLDVKNEFGPSLFSNRDKFEQIFGRAVQTDPGLHSTAGVVNLLDTLIGSAGRPVRQVPFQANLLPNSVTASQAQIQASVNAFLHGRQKPPTRHTAAVAQAVHHKRHRAYIHLSLSPTPGSELAQARAAAKGMSFPLEYPRVRNQSGSGQPAVFRDYYLRGTDHIVHRAYVAAIPAGSLDQYYDVQGMTWPSAPLFTNPDQQVRVGGRTYYLYYDGSSVKMVAWFEHGAAYWIRNSLIKSVGNSEMLAIAEETVPFGVPAAAPGRRRAGLGAFGLPARPQITKGGTDTLQTLGAVAAVVALLGMVALVVPVVRRRRELMALRAKLRTSLDAEARAHASLYGRRPAAYTARRLR